MIIGVLSDTHQNHPLMLRAVDILVNRLRASHLIHLGDDWEDKEALDRLGYSVSGVPGLWCDAYRDPHIPRMRVDVFEGKRLAYAHDKKELPFWEKNIAVFLSGHTHQPVVEVMQDVPHINPGHLCAETRRGTEATFGLVTLEMESLSLAIYGLDGNVRLSRAFPQSQPD